MCPPPSTRFSQPHPGALPLKSSRWAECLNREGEQVLRVGTGVRPVAMPNSFASGEPLVSNGHLGADVIRLAAGEGFAAHTHAGDHLLIILGGEGTIAYRGAVFPTHAGEIYLVEGEEPHAVGAITDHVILAVGSPHKSIDAPDRMTLVEYEAIAAHFDHLHCLICNVEAQLPSRLHDVGCVHCPCHDCNLS